MLKRLKTKGEIEGLYNCGESTVMGTGTPAVTVSGISVANLILRECNIFKQGVIPVQRKHEITAGIRQVSLNRFGVAAQPFLMCLRGLVCAVKAAECQRVYKPAAVLPPLKCGDDFRYHLPCRKHNRRLITRSADDGASQFFAVETKIASG